jgi:hypothetical protein
MQDIETASRGPRPNRRHRKPKPRQVNAEIPIPEEDDEYIPIGGDDRQDANE